MTRSVDLTRLETHFDFGKNWAAYAEKIGDAEVDKAVAGLDRLVGGDNLAGKKFLDIGCGSGLHSLAALRLGAAEVVALDLDPDSVGTARAVLSRHASGRSYHVEQASVFDISTTFVSRFDIVYSWGVLHHTGDMRRALRAAPAFVAPSGLFVFALYRKTWMCDFWAREKRWYAAATPKAQERARALYVWLSSLSLLVRGRRLRQYVDEYGTNSRGMDYYHDVHDWLGGYPYESISPADVERLMTDIGFEHVRSFTRNGKLLGRDSGLLGSGCDEYVYRRPYRR